MATGKPSVNNSLKSRFTNPGAPRSVRDPDTVIEDVEGRKAHSVRTCLKLVDAAAHVQHEVEALDDLASQTMRTPLLS